ncbi:unnamed protein product [Choristocarpus tenellus]
MTDEARSARASRFGVQDQMWSVQVDEQGLRPADVFIEDPDRADPIPGAKLMTHKVHVFSLDKEVCGKIRDNDVKARTQDGYPDAYFEGFGPRYVEWLSDWSFNVVFADEADAKAAFAATSFPLPSPLPTSVKACV